MPDSSKHCVHIDIDRLTEILFPEGSLGGAPVSWPRARSAGETRHTYNNSSISGFASDIAVSKQFEGEFVQLLVSGFAESVYRDDDGFHVEKIVSAHEPPAQPRRSDLAELKICAWFFATDKPIGELCLDLVYCCGDEDEESLFSLKCRPDELQSECELWIQTYLDWCDKNERHRRDLRLRLQQLKFPFDGFRSGQYELSKAVYRCIRDGVVLFGEAPTGTGKTAAVLFPALKAQAHDFCDKIFYLTAKNAGAASAEKAASLFNGAGAGLRWITITAKSRICFTNGDESSRPQCSPQSCPYALDYFSRRDAALESLFSETDFCREKVEAIARLHTLCPFELSLDLALFCDLVICDYNHVFDPQSRLKRFFDFGKTEHVLLIDEAHNMIDRVRAMFSVTLAKSDIMLHRKGSHSPLKKSLDELNKAFIALRKNYDDSDAVCEESLPAEIAKAAQKCRRKIEYLLDGGVSLSESQLQFYFQLLSFNAIAERYSDSYRTVIKKTKTDTELSLRCIDTAQEVEAVVAQQRSAVFFSATLSPGGYYEALLSPTLAHTAISLDSPFDRERCLYFLRSDLSTRYKFRDENLPAYAALVRILIEKVSGNIVVFSPSFKFQGALVDALGIEGRGDTGRFGEIAIQSAAFTSTDREEFIDKFHTRTNLKAFCVCGGSFSESVDLPGEKLIGVIIFGVGLPQIGFDNDIIKDYFQQKFSAGYQFAYMFPGFNKILQAAGRVIRTEEDRGFVVLVDDRYGSGDYRRLIPPHWKLQPKTDENTIIEKVTRLLELNPSPSL